MNPKVLSVLPIARSQSICSLGMGVFGEQVHEDTRLHKHSRFVADRTTRLHPICRALMEICKALWCVLGGFEEWVAKNLTAHSLRSVT